MPVTLTEADAFGASVSFPAPLDAGSVADGSPLKNFAQEIANRTRWVKNLLDGGVKKIRTVADLTALRGITGQANGDIAFATDSLGRRAFWLYDTSSSGAEAAPYRIKPTGFADVTAGRWVHFLAYFGIAQATEADNKLQFRGLGSIVEIIDRHDASTTTFSAAAWENVTGLSISKSLTIGDVLDVESILVWATDDASATQSFRLRVETPSGNAVLDGTETTLHAIANGKRMQVVMRGRYTATEGGTHTINTQVNTSAGGPVNVTAYLRSSRGLWIRP